MRLMATLALMGLFLMSGCNDAPSHAAPVTPASQGKLYRPFPKAATVKLFVESGKYTEDGAAILLSEAGRLLTPSERATFEAGLRVVPIDPTKEIAACFIPHHFFRYYDEAGKQIGEVAVCFCCGGFSVTPGRFSPLEDTEMNYAKLYNLVKDMGLPTDIECEDETGST